MRRLTTSLKPRCFVKMTTLCSLTLLAFTVTQPAQAQDPRRGYGVGVAGQGTDMWTQAMSGLRLFTPHRDDCNATTEVFVKVYENANSVDFGFCMEKDERPGQNWEDAKHTCLSEGKRLPEPAEWKYACDSVTGLNNMTGGWEWISNFGSLEISHNGSGIFRMYATTAAGNNGCANASYAQIMDWNSIAGSIAFRCLR
ncbi:MAG: hypothetical protein RIB43_15070 [Rhodospirillaceae bacterium]